MRASTFFRFLHPRYFLGSKGGRCILCGRATLYFLTDTPETIRNHAVCVRCGASARHRHLALWVVNEFADRGIRRLSDFRAHPNIKVLNTSSGSPVAKALGTAPNIVCSEYFDGVEPGGFRNGVQNQDLQNLTFEDGSLDLILSEDVFEHIPDLKRGLREVHRVLKRGGMHIFTIPFHFDRKTRDLFTIKDGKAELIEPIEYHGDPIRGNIPTYTHVGYDILEFLEATGFETRIEISRFADCERYATFDCFTFVTRKR
ncbi:MAG: class I SAM-dependent methyltransferase [Fibrobacterota bacterium]|nr:class I SAM-dependent methyltransferase [Fibrobacterota bacterium]